MSIQVRAFEIDLRLLWWCGITLFPVLSIWLLKRGGARLTVGRLAAAFSLTTLLALVQTTVALGIGVPTAASPGINVSLDATTSETRVTTEAGGVIAVNITTQVENLSDRRLEYTGGYSVLWGVKSDLTPPVAGEALHERLEQKLEDQEMIVGDASRMVRDLNMSAVQFKFNEWRPGTWLSPGQKVQGRAVSYVPADEYDSLVILSMVAVAYADELEVADHTPIIDNPTDPSVFGRGLEYALEETSVLRRLTRDDRVLHVGYVWHRGNPDVQPELLL